MGIRVSRNASYALFLLYCFSYRAGFTPCFQSFLLCLDDDYRIAIQPVTENVSTYRDTYVQCSLATTAAVRDRVPSFPIPSYTTIILFHGIRSAVVRPRTMYDVLSGKHTVW